MRVAFAVVLFAAAASAVSLQHASLLGDAPELRTPFAASVLAELDAALASGGPADTLMRLINDIRERLNQAQNADTSQNTRRQSECDAEESVLRSKIAGLETEIHNNAIDQQNAREAMQQWKHAMEASASFIEQKKLDINETVENIAENNRKRAYEKEVYQNRTEDTQECIQAIKEIIELEGDSLLSAGKIDEVEGGGIAQHWRSLLETTANKVTDSHAKGMVQAASASAATGIDTTSLKNLLTTLLDELNKYESELHRDEEAAQKQHDEVQADLAATEAAQREELAAKEEQLKQETAQYQKQVGELARLELDLEQRLQPTLLQTQNDLEAHLKQCQDWQDAYDKRSAERSDEQQTLTAVEKIVRDKLGHLMDDASRTGVQGDTYNRVQGVGR
jgi:hypothetical protein